jgi:hypothetical protein
MAGSFLIALLLAADGDGGTALTGDVYKDAKGVVWTVHSDASQELEHGMGSRRHFTVFRDGAQVGDMSERWSKQYNPKISESEDWTFRVKDGVFEAESQWSRNRQGRPPEKRTTLLRWDGKALSPVSERK